MDDNAVRTMNQQRSSTPSPILKQRSHNGTNGASTSDDGGGMMPSHGCVFSITPPSAKSTRIKQHLAASLHSEETDSETESVDIACGCSTHESRQLIAPAVIDMSVEQLFVLLFTDTPFARQFAQKQQLVDVVASQWATAVTEETGAVRQRTLNYQKLLNSGGNLLAPKQAFCNETQRIHVDGAGDTRGQRVYVVACEVTNNGVPYSENFVVRTRYCICRVGRRRCRLTVHGGVVFVKSTWSFVKTMIEKASMQGLEEYFVGLMMALRHESQFMMSCGGVDSMTGNGGRTADESTSATNTSASSKRRRSSAKSPSRQMAACDLADGKSG